MERIKANLREHKKLYIGLSVLALTALICVILRVVFYYIADIRDDIPYADIGDLSAGIAYFIIFFLGILSVGSIIWLIAAKLGIKAHICWYIIGVNTLIVIISLYFIIVDLFISQSWLRGIATFIFGLFVIPINIVVYIFCIIMMRSHTKKSNDKRKQIEANTLFDES